MKVSLFPCLEMKYTQFTGTSPADVRRLAFQDRPVNVKQCWILIPDVPDTPLNREIYQWATLDGLDVCIMQITRWD